MAINTCGWCLESGEGELICINSSLVLYSHGDCIHEAAVSEHPCVCFEKAGDNPLCLVPAHGG